MAYKSIKIIDILMEEAEKTEGRDSDYIEKLKGLLGTIVSQERDHTISKTDINKSMEGQIDKFADSIELPNTEE